MDQVCAAVSGRQLPLSSVSEFNNVDKIKTVRKFTPSVFFSVKVENMLFSDRLSCCLTVLLLCCCLHHMEV